MNRILLVFISLFSIVALAQKPTIEARISSKNVIVNETFELSIICNHELDFNYPDLSSFELSPANKQYSAQTEIQGSKIYKTENFITSHAIKASKPGTYTIGSFSFKFNGKEFKTEPISITVSDAPNENSTIESNLNKNFYADYTLNKTEVYIGEPIYLFNKLYSRARIMDLRDFKKGDVVGNIDVKEINKDGNVKFEIEKINGQLFQSAKFGEQIVFPTGTGNIQVEPYSISVIYDDDWFGNQINVKSLPRTITVKPLPENGMPEDFCGGVGNFKMKVTSNKNKLDVGDVVEMKVTISGTGNIHLINEPKMDLGVSFELYGDPVVEDTFDISISGTKGEINYIYLLRALKAGKTKLPEVHLSYFNPKKVEYVSIHSEEDPINIEGDPSVNISKHRDPKSINKSNSETASLEPAEELGTLVNTNSFWTNSLLITSLPMPLFIAFILGFAIKKREKGNSGKQQERLLKKKEKEIIDQLSAVTVSASTDFYSSIDQLIRDYFSIKTGIPSTSISKKDIESWMKNKDYEESKVSEFVTLMEKCEMFKYSSFQNQITDEDRTKEISILKSIIK